MDKRPILELAIERGRQLAAAKKSTPQPSSGLPAHLIAAIKRDRDNALVTSQKAL